jgi:hypothetical protein
MEFARMRFPRLAPLAACVAVAALAACNDDEVTIASRPPLAGVRYINALPDTGTVDIRMVDQLEYSANTSAGTGGLIFREGTEYFPVEAKARKIRVFSLQNTSLTTVSSILVDTTISFEANKKYTLLLTGLARSRTARFRVIEDVPPSVATGSIAVRTFNAGAGQVDAYLLPATTTAVTGTPAFAGVADMSATSYQVRPAGAFAVRVAPAGSTTAVASVQAATGTAGTATVNPVAGAAVAGTVFSAYVFPRSVAGSGAPQTAAFQTTGVQLFVDQLPANTATP